MKYHSLSDNRYTVSFTEAVVQGMAPDGALFMPEVIPQIGQGDIQKFPEMSLQEIAAIILEKYLNRDFKYPDIRQIIQYAFTFDCPVVQLEENVWALELFHGPTLAFKDFGARFLAAVLDCCAQSVNRQITVLVATSGDTGSAVAHAFHAVRGVRVIILYPEGRVSYLQEKQLATFQNNIQAIRIRGSFDDCQRLVKKAIADPELRSELFITSANSINIARWLPQSVYYAYAWSRLSNKSNVVFSVPSGNLGNLTAGILAKKMGLPVRAFVAATNINDVIPRYLLTRVFKPAQSVPTISNAMDVGNPNNFSRLRALFNDNWWDMVNEVSGYAFTDEETREAVRKIFRQHNYVVDPHGAVSWLGLKSHLSANPADGGVFLATAHPAKFGETISPLIDYEIPLPDELNDLKGKQVVSISMNNEFSELKKYLLNR